MTYYEELFDRIKMEPGFLQQKLQEDTELMEDVRNSILNQTQKYAEWGYLSALADTEAKRAKYVWQDEYQPTCRESAEADLGGGAKKPTLQAIADRAAKYPLWAKGREEYLAAEQLASICKAAVEAMKHRLFMVQSLNSRQKAELNAYPQD